MSMELLAWVPIQMLDAQMLDLLLTQCL